MAVTEFLDYRAYLKAELEKRTRLNSRYSLRAFSRDLKLSPQRLSFILSGKRGLTEDSAATLADHLGLSKSEANYLGDLVRYSRLKTEDSKRALRDRLTTNEKTGDRFSILKHDTFEVISNWVHFAILELTFTSDFKSDEKWIAKRLGISAHEAKLAIERLIKLGLLRKESGSLKKTETNIGTTNDAPSDAIKNFNRQILSKAIEALTLQSVQERDFSTMTMAVDPTQLKKAKKMIRDFRRELMTVLESGERTEVYCFSAQLFKLTTSTNNI